MTNAATITLYISDESFADSLGAAYSIDEIRALGFTPQIVFTRDVDAWEPSILLGPNSCAIVSDALERALCRAAEKVDPWEI